MRIIILGSGRGSNCKALLDAYESRMLGSSEIIAVFSDVSKSGIMEVARTVGIPGVYLGHYSPTNLKQDDYWISEIKEFQPDLVVLAGFMRILSRKFIQAFDSKIINLHPSLLPSFRGLNAIQQAFDAGVKITGCTVHWVTSELDCGKIIAQAPVRIMPSDTLESVTAKVHAAEHMLLPGVVSEISEGFHR